MIKKKAIITIVLILLTLTVLVAFFFPQKRVEGGLRGFIGPGQTSYRVEYSCFGIKRDFCPPWPDYGCDYLCYGILYDKTCFDEVYELGVGITQKETICR